MGGANAHHTSTASTCMARRLARKGVSPVLTATSSPGSGVTRGPGGARGSGAAGDELEEADWPAGGAAAEGPDGAAADGPDGAAGGELAGAAGGELAGAADWPEG